MATDIESIGYGGTVTEANTALWAAAVGGGDYGVKGDGHWEITPAAGDRTVKMALGTGWGRSVVDTVTGDLPTKQLDIVSSGSRYDLLVWRRDWAGAGGTSSLEVVEGNASETACLGLRNTDWPTLDDQPLAIVKVTAGSTIPVVVHDLRAWQSNGGLVAVDPLVREYLTAMGTSVRVGGVQWDRVPDGFGGSKWDSTIPTPASGARRWLGSRAGVLAAGHAFDEYAAGSWVGLCSVALPATAPAGLYHVDACWVGVSVSGGAMSHSLRLSGAGDVRGFKADLAGLTATFTPSATFAHAGGAATFRLEAFGETPGLAARVYNTWPFIEVTYLGPAA